MTCQPSATRSPTFSLALDDGSVSYELEMSDEIDAGRRVTRIGTDCVRPLVFATPWRAVANMTYRSCEASANGGKWFVHDNLRVGAGDTHFVAYRGWDGEGAMTLYVDRGSDGFFDDAISLENPAAENVFAICLS